METFTFLFADVEGSTALLRRLGEGLYTQVLAGYRGLIRAALDTYGGQEVDTPGDGFFAVFSSPSACVAAVLDMQQAFAGFDWPAGEQLRVRMGAHTGEASRTASGLVGLDVHRAARVAAVGYGGQALLSETAASLVRDSLPPGASLLDLGSHRLKDLGRPESIFQLVAAGLRADFPPLRSLGNPAFANNLPVQLATFIGRKQELAEVRALVRTSRLVTLSGAGGTGKTRLSLQAAAELLDGSGDGVWLVELAAVSDGDTVPLAISETLGIAGHQGRPVLESLLDALEPQDLLIVLDNCEHLIDACAKTTDAILRRCPRVHLITTSREPLGIAGEAIYRVPPLSLPPAADDPVAGDGPILASDAVALFVDRARAQGTSVPVEAETIPLIVSVCRRLDGLPLAIELAVARLRSLSLRGLADRLDQRFRLLTGGSRAALERQQTLRATVDWSYSLLNETEQALLRRLSVFADTFDLDAAEAVCGFGDIDAFDVADLIGALVDKSLVVAEPTGDALRYRLLETIRQFAAERLAETGETKTGDAETGGDGAAVLAAAHLRHFLTVAEAAAPHLTGSEQPRWFGRLDADRANLRQAFWHAAHTDGGTVYVLRFAVALDRYWMARERAEEGFALLMPVLERPEARADLPLFTRVLSFAALSAGTVDRATSLRLGGQALELARQLDSDKLLIVALSVLCTSCYFAGHPEEGERYGAEAVERARPLGDDVTLAESLSAYLLCGDLIDPARAEALYAEAIAATERSGDVMFRCILHNNAAVHALRAGDFPAARGHLEQAQHATEETGEKNYAIAINLGWVRRHDGDTDGARFWFGQAFTLSRHNGFRTGHAYACLGLACLATDAGDWSRAVLLHGAAQAFLDQNGEAWQDPEAAYREESLNQAREHLGAEAAGHDFARGVALSFEEAYDLASGRESR
ncbi:MAG: adenylate/guanylate cyclase domain-containing protein [Streptosporangiaceae bacterium]